MTKLSAEISFFLIFGTLSRVSSVYADGQVEFVDESKTRNKRILYGEPLLDVRSYEVTRFIVYISSGDCAARLGGWFRWYLGMCEPPPEGHLECGGALIAENVVQTACHCIVYFYPTNDIEMGSVPLTVWETPFAMYLGHFDVHEMTGGTRARQFLNHRKCKMYYSEKKNSRGSHVTYDLGIIITRNALIKDQLLTRQAPVYSVLQLKSLYDKIQRYQRVCLLAGWGWYQLTEDKKSGILSRYLQHSWTRVKSFNECYNDSKWVRKFIQLHGDAKNITYKNLKTWFCTKGFGRMRGAIGGGDSGSPVTCNNEYLGLVSSSIGPEDMTIAEFALIVGWSSAIRFSELENGAEFRRGFLKKILDLLVYPTDLPYRHDEFSRGPNFHFNSHLIWTISITLLALDTFLLE